MWEIKQSVSEDSLDLYIYGDVEALKIDWSTWDVSVAEASAQHFREQLALYPDTKQINVFINSYGGSVFEGMAIYNQLRRHPAHKTGYNDGFACSVALVILLACDEVVWPKNAMGLAHNAWLGVQGNAKELRKAADDLDAIMVGNRQAFLRKSAGKITEEQLIEVLDAETWLTADGAMKLGFADRYADQDVDMSQAAEILQLMNANLSQRVNFYASLADQLRELVNPIIPVQKVEPEPPKDPAPADPAQDKKLKLFAAKSR